MLEQLRLRTRIFAAFALMAAFSIGAGLLNLWSVQRLGGSLDGIVQRSLPILRASLEADMAHDCVRASVFRALLGAEVGNTGEMAEGIKEFREASKVFVEALAAVEKAGLGQDLQAVLVPVQASLSGYLKSGENIATLLHQSAGKPELRNAQVAFQNAFDALATQMEALSDGIQKDIDSAQATGEQVARVSKILAGVSTVLALVAALLIAFLLDRQITTPLGQAVSALEDASGQVLEASNQISDGSRSLARTASDQAASLEETSASLEQISAMTKRNADSAGSSKALSEQAKGSATSGLERIAALGRTLTGVKGAVGEMESAVREMQASSQEIAKIIRTIDEIAFQTNLLALNAAVEAARAGEAGAGFAVVADEVRALAQRSAQAAKDTSERIESAVKRSELGGVASRKVSQSLVEIEATSRSIEQVFNGIVGQIRSLDDLVGEIAAASKEQSQGVAEVNMAVSQIDRVTQSNAALAEENSSASEELNAQSRSVNGIVSALRDMVRGAGTGREQAQSLRESRRVGSHTGSGRGQSTVQTNDGAGSVVASQDGDIPMPGHSGAGQTSSRDF